MSVDRAADGVPRKPRATHRVQSVERAVALLKATAAAPHPASVWELARTCGVNRSTAWRLLGTLEAQGLVERDPVTQRYTVGYEAIQVAGAAGYDGLARRVRPLLQRLAETAGESVTLAAARRFSLVYVDQVDPPGVACPDWMGRSLPLHATSSGKVFLAWLPDEERDAVLAPHLEAYTPRTITDRRPARPRAGRDPAHRVRHLRRRARGVPERRVRGGARPADAADGDREHLGPEPAGDPEAAPGARPDGAPRGARGLAGAGVNWEAFITCAVTGAGDTTGRSPLVPVTPVADRRRRDRGGPGGRCDRPHPRARPGDRPRLARSRALPRGGRARAGVRRRRRHQPDRRDGRRPGSGRRRGAAPARGARDRSGRVPANGSSTSRSSFPRSARSTAAA